jgi:D-alanyl-D-alanine carboxypeptidase
MCCLTILLLIYLWPIHAHAAEKRPVADDAFFTLENGTNLRILGGKTISHMLVRIRGQGKNFGEAQRKRYCKLKKAQKIQWALNDLETGKIISRSVNADEVYFGASASKLFVTAALLNKQDRQFDSAQLTLNEIYGLAILSNTGSGEDVAILGGGLMR